MTDVREPRHDLADPKILLLDFLDHYRAVVARKMAGLGPEELRGSRLPSGWSPLELLKHLVYMEERWIRWGFAAEPVPHPWGDQDDEGRWQVRPEETVDALLAAMDLAGARTREIAERARFDDRAAVGGRFATAADAPTLGWILTHVLQEYARHAGHLDIARELIDGAVGE
ncbi:DinB family protein [Asanoa sp. WMMD1127]|uniref:DinB family protein n=1 Tax=Asanoa sp. WMMD1127 TaxID=3016107 RepID=UPI0024176821|nr:DinB family protein [Asanoa sp. WMMD1127]MDG4824122.1 DinB family protein [Asanoa sp. WMMD1127]